jgi:hypothetical protein
MCDIYPGELFVKNFLQNVELDPSILNESEAKFPSQSNGSLKWEEKKFLKGPSSKIRIAWEFIPFERKWTNLYLYSRI